MPSQGETQAVATQGDEPWDPFSTSTLDDPYSRYQVLRDEQPLFQASCGVWAVSRFADVQAVARDWRNFASTPSVDLDDTTKVIGAGNVIDSDPPYHDHLRDVVRKSFSPRLINEKFSGSVQRAVTELLDAICGRGGGDLASEFAWPLPVIMISELLGLPANDRPRLQNWVIAFAEREPHNPRVPASMKRAGQELSAYLEQMIAERQHSPGDDLLSDMLRAEHAGLLTREEVQGLALLLCDAGTQTTAGLIGNALLALERFPDQRRILQKHPEIAAAAVEEFLRFDAPVQYLARRTTRDAELLGEVLPAGSRLALLWGSANRDERRFPDGERLDLGREPQRNLGFGEGIHFCLGAPLARLEARIALAEFAQRVSDYELTGPIERQQSHATRGLTSLPIALS